MSSHAEAWAAALAARKQVCSGYCVGVDSIYTLVEDLACPVHGIKAQEKAALTFSDRETWLNSVREALAGDTE
jgi:hypothetical protein